MVLKGVGVRLRRFWKSKTGVLAVSLLLGTIYALPGWFHLLDWGRRAVAVEQMRSGDFSGTASRRVVVSARPDAESAYESSVMTRGGRDRWLCVPLLPLSGPASANSESVWALIPIEESAEAAAGTLAYRRSFEGVLRNVLWEQQESAERLTGPEYLYGYPGAMVIQVGRNPQTDLASIFGAYLLFVGVGVLVLLVPRLTRSPPITGGPPASPH
jgi:hypothetical protein